MPPQYLIFCGETMNESLGLHQSIRNSIAGWFFTAEEIESTMTNGHMLNPSIDLSNPCNLNRGYAVERKCSRNRA
jgi:hypothetical protein